MANETNFWKLWAPHLVYLEDNHLDLRTIGALSEKIVSPVLVVGGGQGLLVHELQKKGFRVDGVDSSPEMVKLAEQRRGVKLILTDGSTLPFADESAVFPRFSLSMLMSVFLPYSFFTVSKSFAMNFTPSFSAMSWNMRLFTNSLSPGNLRRGWR